MWQGMDRRRFPRAHYRCKIIVVHRRHKEKLSTFTENIGLGGVCVVLSKELDKFSEAELLIYLEDGQMPLDCVGRIVWVVRREFAEPNKAIEYDPTDVRIYNNLAGAYYKIGNFDFRCRITRRR